MKGIEMNFFNHFARVAVSWALKSQMPNLEEAAISWLFRNGFYSGLTCDEAWELDSAVRAECLKLF